MGNNPRRAIISDEAVGRLLVELDELPERIQTAQDLIEDAQFRLSQMTDGIVEQAELDNIRAETYFEVKEEKVEGNGKAKYSNAEERDAQVTLRCNQDPAYIKALSAVANAKRSKAEAQMHLGKLINQVKYLVNRSYALKSAAAVIAGLSVEEIDNDAFVKLAQIKADLSAFVERMEIPRG
jgi:hypothetical protein